jgi:hypothetical protein
VIRAHALLALASLLAPAAAAAQQKGGFTAYGVFGATGAGPRYYHTLRGVEFGGTWIVQPNGIASRADPATKNMSELFATGHVWKLGGPEVLQRYYKWFPGTFGIFKHNCSPEHPCDTVGRGRRTTPGYVLFWEMRDHPEYLFDFVDVGGHRHKAMRYVTRIQELGDARLGRPARWHESTFFWNERDQAYDLLFEHEYVREKLDCADPQRKPCRAGSWLAVLELWYDAKQCPESAWPCQLPRIREIGYQDVTIVGDDGVRRRLDAPGTTFQTVPDARLRVPWLLRHRVGHHSFGVGNFPADRPRAR